MSTLRSVTPSSLVLAAVVFVVPGLSFGLVFGSQLCANGFVVRLLWVWPLELDSAVAQPRVSCSTDPEQPGYCGLSGVAAIAPPLNCAAATGPSCAAARPLLGTTLHQVLVVLPRLSAVHAAAPVSRCFEPRLSALLFAGRLGWLVRGHFWRCVPVLLLIRRLLAKARVQSLMRRVGRCAECGRRCFVRCQRGLRGGPQGNEACKVGRAGDLTGMGHWRSQSNAKGPGHRPSVARWFGCRQGDTLQGLLGVVSGIDGGMYNQTLLLDVGWTHSFGEVLLSWLLCV